jgi:hypothetical protein
MKTGCASTSVDCIGGVNSGTGVPLQKAAVLGPKDLIVGRDATVLVNIYTVLLIERMKQLL